MAIAPPVESEHRGKKEEKKYRAPESCLRKVPTGYSNYSPPEKQISRKIAASFKRTSQTENSKLKTQN
jgi:hypothetical protein